MFDFGQNLRDLRLSRNLTQQQVSSDCDIPYRSYQNYEENRGCPNYKVLIKLCRYYRVSSDYLLGLSDNPELK